MIENIINNLLPIRNIFGWDFILLNSYLFLVILIWYFLKNKKIKINTILIYLILYYFIIVVLKIKLLAIYYLWLYTFCLLFIWYFIGFIHDKKSNLKIENKPKLSKRYDYIFILIIILYICLYITINNWNFHNIIEADSWIHLSKILKSDNNNLSPLFLWEYHHYPQFSYFNFNYISNFLWIKDISFFYWLAGLFLWVITYILYYILISNFTRDKRVALLSLTLLINFNYCITPNYYLLFLLLIIFLLIFKLLKYKEKILLKILLIVLLIIWIYFTHYFWAVLISIFIFTFISLCLFNKIFHKINNFFIKIYDNFIWNTALSLNLVIIILLLVFLSYIIIWPNILYISYSEIGLNYNNIIYFIGIAFIIPIIGMINKIYYKNNLIIIFFYSIIIFFSNIIFYYSHLFLFHWRYFPEYSIKVILWPFSILLLLNIFFKKSKSQLLIIFIVLIYILSTNYNSYNYLHNYINNSNSYREKLIYTLIKYKEKLESKVLFIEPHSFLNRYVVVDLNSYIYAVNYKERWPKPFTTIPRKIDKYNFSNPWERYKLSTNFFNNPNLKNYKALFKYKIDYFIFDKEKDKNIIIFFKENKFDFIETEKYFIFSKKKY